MCNDASTVVNMIGPLALYAAGTGMLFGFTNRRRNVDAQVHYQLAVYGLGFAFCVALMMKFVPLSASGLEICGFILCLLIFVGALGSGLSIVWNRRQ